MFDGTQPLTARVRGGDLGLGLEGLSSYLTPNELGFNGRGLQCSSYICSGYPELEGLGGMWE